VTEREGLMSGRWQHKKRGTTYQLLGRAEMQSETPVAEGDHVEVYRSEQDGKLWVRPPGEFHDGRFEKLPADADSELMHAVETIMPYTWRPLAGYEIVLEELVQEIKEQRKEAVEELLYTLDF